MIDDESSNNHALRRLQRRTDECQEDNAFLNDKKSMPKWFSCSERGRDSVRMRILTMFCFNK